HAPRPGGNERSETGDPVRRFAYDHDRIVPDALERARSKLEYTALATAFVAEPFTLGELRGVYEAVWGVSLDPANFRRKVVSTRDFIVPVEGLAKPGPGGGRPAQRYRRGSAERLHPAMLRP
ncbi:NrtR DNA-binding winged helix domain-containing protein, partial [Nitriliruptor alkaliphilus]